MDCIEWVAACFDYYAEVGRRSYGASIPPVAAHQINFTIKEPLGVVAAIVPFNYPLLLLVRFCFGAGEAGTYPTMSASIAGTLRFRRSCVARACS